MGGLHCHNGKVSKPKSVLNPQVTWKTQKKPLGIA